MGGRTRRAEKVIRKFFVSAFILVLSFILWNPVPRVKAADGNISLEQAYVNLPQIWIYANGMENYGTPEADQVEIYRGEEKLALNQIQKFSETKEGAAYYVLVDVSGSVKDGYFRDIKKALQTFAKGLREQDRLALITFGEEVQVKLTGEESKSQVKKTIEKLQNNDDRTLLFEALAQAGDMASSLAEEGCKRKVAIVISDGEDIAKGKATKKEALEHLKEQGLPVYALAVDYEEKSVTDSFGEFARNTGGRMRIFGEGEAAKALKDIKKQIMDSTVLMAESGNNTVSQSMETLTVQFSQWNLTKTLKTGFYRWQEDQEAPEITAVSQSGKRKLTVTYSEPVKNGKEASNYQLKDQTDGSILVPVSVEMKEDAKAVLTFKDVFYSGSYHLGTVNITDCSMENNLVTKEKEVSLDGEEKPSGLALFFKENGYIAAILLVVALAVTAGIIYRRIRKNKGIVVVDGKLTTADQVEVKRHVAIDTKKAPQLIFTMKSKGKYPARMEVPIKGSLIVGRSDICDVYMDDEQMSRQHFALEYENGQLFVTDLETTNGTTVNGVRIQGRHRLERKDLVCAGTVEMMIDWGEED